MAQRDAMEQVPILIGLDWGSSSLRAYLYARKGQVIDRRVAPLGVLNVADRAFAAARDQVIGAWRSPGEDLPVIASGMIGSTVGWREVPYVACPAGPAELGPGLRAQRSAQHGDGLVIVPGLAVSGSPAPGAAPDVMRGEETQIFGALAQHPKLARICRLVMPGTHSKWVSVTDGQITRFKTYMTGELFAVLKDHSILGRPAKAAILDGARAGQPGTCFERGVAVAQDGAAGGVSGHLFSVRTRVLMGEILATDSLDYLSGLLIGDELRSELSRPTEEPLALIGDPAICALYQRALAMFKHPGVTVIGDSASVGLWRLAVAAGLVDG